LLGPPSRRRRVSRRSQAKLRRMSAWNRAARCLKMAGETTLSHRMRRRHHA
jgi:hypothetical protein